MRSSLIVLLALFGLAEAGRAKQKVDDINLYDASKTPIINLTKLNFNAQVSANRKGKTSIVHYYKKDDGKSEAEIKQEYIDFATENDGIFKANAVNCDEHADICIKEGVKTYPTVKIYPPLPIPVNDYDLETKFTNKVLRQKVAKYVVDKTTEITQANLKVFLEEDVSTPKVLLFTKAPKGTPWAYKVLSQNLEKTLQFGLVRDNDAIAKQYKVKSWPTLFVIKAEGKPIKFDVKDKSEFNYNKMFEFLNVHSQIFVDPNSVESQSTVKKSSAAKPWLVKPVAQLTKDSGNDLCLQKDGSLCIILVAKNEDDVKQQHLDVLHQISQGFASKISRGIQFIVSYLIAEEEPDFTKKFQLESHDKPQVVILNPGKRKRFLLHDGDIAVEHLEKTLDKILGGDARFKNIKGNELPKLVSTYPEDTK